MSGYKYRDPSRVGAQPVFTATDKRVDALEQENERLVSERDGVRISLKKATAQADYYKKCLLELSRQRIQAVEEVSGRMEANRSRVLSVLGALRTERQKRAGERSHRLHAESALSRSEQRTDQVRRELVEERAAREIEVKQLRGALADSRGVLDETRVKQLEGALADQQRITADRTRERDMARGQAIAAWATVDRTHTLLTRNQPTVFEAKRLARVWGIDFERPEGEVA